MCAKTCVYKSRRRLLPNGSPVTATEDRIGKRFSKWRSVWPLSLAGILVCCLTPYGWAQGNPTDVDSPNNQTLMRYLIDIDDRLKAVEDGSGATEPTEAYEVDLSDTSQPFDSEAESTHVLAKPWYENFEFWGFIAADVLATGDDGTEPNGGFILKETTLFVEGQIWDDVSGFFELQINRLGKDDSLFVRTGEVHVHFRNVLKHLGDDLLGIKVGRVDIPFGEEYLWQDSIDNPLITQSAGYPYGFDEGIVLYGTLSGVGWIVAVTDGTDERSIEDDADKAVNVKIYGNPNDWLYLSGSFMRNGQAAKSAFEFGGSHFQPIGASHPSSLGMSPSDKVDAFLYEIDAKITLSDNAYIAIAFGQAFQDDGASAFNRDLLWFSIEGLYNLNDKVYAVIRYSEIGTYDSGEGYHFDGKITAGGNSAFGYDARRFQRLSVGMGWKINPRTVLKVEVGGDWFEVIDASSFTPGDDDRWLAGVELVVGF